MNGKAIKIKIMFQIPTKTASLNNTDMDIFRLISTLQEKLEIPAYLDVAEINETLEDATILWQSDNGHNFCVLACWVDLERPFNSIVYFTRFFGIGQLTVCSHDATGDNLLDALFKITEIANKHFKA